MAAGGQPRTSSPAAGPLGQETSGTITSSYNTTLQDAAAGVGLSFQDKPYAYNHTDGNLLMLPQLLDAAGQKKSPIVILKEYLDDEPNLFRAREVFRKLDRDVDGMLGRWEFVTFVQLLPGFSKLKLRLNDLLGIYDVVDDTKCNAISMPELLASLRRKARGGRPTSARRRRSRPSSAASSLSSRAQRLADGFGTFGAPPAVTAALAAAASAATTAQTGAGDPPKPRSARLASRRTYDRPWSASAALPKREPSTTAPPNPFLLHPQKFSTVGTTPTPGRAVKLFEQNQVRTSLLESLPGGARLVQMRTKRWEDHLEETLSREAVEEERKMNKRREQVLCRGAIRASFADRQETTRQLEVLAGQRPPSAPPASSSPDMKPPRAPLAEPPPPPNVRLHWGGELFTYSLKQSV